MIVKDGAFKIVYILNEVCLFILLMDLLYLFEGEKGSYFSTTLVYHCRWTRLIVIVSLLFPMLLFLAIFLQGLNL